MTADFEKMVTHDPSGFVVLADFIPGIIQEIRYHSTYNFIGDRINGYEEPVALLTIEAARTLKKEHIYQAAMLDPHTASELSVDQIKAMVDDLIEAHKGWLPEYH